MASKEETTEDTDLFKEEAKDEKDKEEDAVRNSVDNEDKKLLKKKTLSFTKQRLSSKLLFSNIFRSKNVSIIQAMNKKRFFLLKQMKQPETF